MTTHLDDTQGLEEILDDWYMKSKEQLKQAILHWVNTEIIGDDDNDDGTESDIDAMYRNDLRAEQRQLLIHHGYKQNTKGVSE